MRQDDDETLLAVRASRNYRQAVWLARLANLVLLPAVVLGVVTMADLGLSVPEPVITGLAVVGGVLLLPAGMLFYRCGAPFGRDGRDRSAEIRFGNAVLRDVFGPRPR